MAFRQVLGAVRAGGPDVASCIEKGRPIPPRTLAEEDDPMTDESGSPASATRPLPPSEMYRLAGERMAELACEVDDLRREVHGGMAGREARRELREAEGRMEECRNIMERAQRLMDSGTAEDPVQVAWESASEAIAVASREERDLTRRRAEFSFELYAQETMSVAEAEDCLVRIEARLAVLATEIQRARLALSLIEARQDRDLSTIGRRTGDGEERRLRTRCDRLY